MSCELRKFRAILCINDSFVHDRGFSEVDFLGTYLFIVIAIDES